MRDALKNTRILGNMFLAHFFLSSCASKLRIILHHDLRDEQTMVLDFDYFRTDQEDPEAITPEKVRKMMADRFKDVTLVDRVVASYAAWRQCLATSRGVSLFGYFENFRPIQCRPIESTEEPVQRCC